MRKLLLASAWFALSAAPLPAAEIDIAWNDCPDSGRDRADEVFDCATNGRARHLLVSSVAARVTLMGLVGTTCEVEIVAESPALPDWWRGDACRAGQLGSIDPAGAAGLAGCSNPFEGTGLFAGVTLVQSLAGDSRRARLVWDSVRESPAAPVPAGEKAIAGALEIRTLKSTGAGACGGCARPGCLVLPRGSPHPEMGPRRGETGACGETVAPGPARSTRRGRAAPSETPHAPPPRHPEYARGAT